MYFNFQKEFSNKDFKDFLQNVAKVTTRHKFKYNMFETLKLNDKDVVLLIRYDPLCWSKYAFRLRTKCDSLVNNLVEAFTT